MGLKVVVACDIIMSYICQGIWASLRDKDMQQVHYMHLDTFCVEEIKRLDLEHPRLAL